MTSYAAKVASHWLQGRSCSDLPPINSTHFTKEPSPDRPMIPVESPSSLGEFLGGIDLLRCHPMLASIGIFPVQARKSQERQGQLIVFPRFPGTTVSDHLKANPTDTEETVDMVYELLDWMLLRVVPLLSFHRINHNDPLPRNVVCRRPLGVSPSPPGDVGSGDCDDCDDGNHLRYTSSSSTNRWHFAEIDWEFATWHKEGVVQAPRVRGFSTSDCSTQFNPDSDLLFFLLSLAERLTESHFPQCRWMVATLWYFLYGVPLDWFLERRRLYCPWSTRPDFGVRRTDLFQLYHRIQEPLRGYLLRDMHRYRDTGGIGPFSSPVVVMHRNSLE